MTGNASLRGAAVREGRRWAASQATGNTLEIALGTGRNLPYYPVGVKLTGVELSDQMLDRARQRAAKLGRQVELCQATRRRLIFPTSGSTAWCARSLVHDPGPRRGYPKAHRVLRPGGALLLVEHVRSGLVGPARPTRGRALMERYADHLLRDRSITRSRGLLHRLCGAPEVGCRRTCPGAPIEQAPNLPRLMSLEELSRQTHEPIEHLRHCRRSV